jgi:Bacterial Ig-like domain
MNTRRIWSLLALVFTLCACGDQGAPVIVNITQPAQSQVTNGALDVRLELSGSKPDELSSLTVILERRKSTDLDVDSSYANLKTFLKGDPYPFAYTWDTVGAPDGEYTLRARATYTRGGFDGQPRTSVSASRAVTIDRSRPGVVSSTPAPDATNVLLKSPITVTFDKPMSATSLTDDSVRLIAGGVALARAVKLSSDGKTLTVMPLTQLSTPKMLNNLKLELSEGATDLLGNKLIPKAWSWVAPAWLRLGELRSNTPSQTDKFLVSFEVGKDGNPVAMLRVRDSSVMTGYKGLFLTRWNGTSWSVLGEDFRRSVPGTDVVGSVSLRFDSNNNPIVAWASGDRDFDKSGVITDIQISYWDGLNWKLSSGLRSTQSPTTLPSSTCSLTLDREGKPIVVWGIVTRGSTQAYDTFGLLVSRLNGSIWESLGGDFRDLGLGTKPLEFARLGFSLLDVSNNLTVFWNGSPNPYSVDTYAHEWDETSKGWKPVFDGFNAIFTPSGTPFFNLTSVVVDAEKYFLGWRTSGDKQFVARKTVASSWALLGADLSSLAVDTSFVSGADLALAASNNNDPVVSVTGSKRIGSGTTVTSENRATLLRWDDTNQKWNAMLNQPPQPSGGLFSPYFSSELRRGPDGTLYVSWPEQDASGFNVTIYRENR